MLDFDALKIAVGDLDETAVRTILDELVSTGGADASLALEACQAGMDIVGARYETGEYYVAELIFAGDLMASAAAMLKPFLSAEDATSVGRMVICTVKGDIHDIGKNIVKSLLEAAGVEVIDLGVDVSAERIVSAVQETGVGVLAMSGVLTLAVDSMKQTVEALTEAGLRDKVKVIIGGAMVTPEYGRMIGADAYTTNAGEGIGICRRWLSEGA